MPLEYKGRTNHLDAELGFSVLRLTLGLNFAFHSYDRWRALAPFVEGTVQAFVHTPLPSWSVKAFAYTIPFLEPAVGLLLVLGLWTRYALLGGGLLIAAFVFGTALRGDHTVLSEQLIYAGIFFLLFLFRARYDRFGIDGWQIRRQGGK